MHHCLIEKKLVCACACVRACAFALANPVNSWLHGTLFPKRHAFSEESHLAKHYERFQGLCQFEQVARVGEDGVYSVSLGLCVLGEVWFGRGEEGEERGVFHKMATHRFH